MKYIITESQKEKMILRYLDDKQFNVVEGSDSLYFYNNLSDKYSMLRYDMADGWLFISLSLSEELRNFFHLSVNDVEFKVAKWFKDKYYIPVERGDVWPAISGIFMLS